MHKVQYQDHSTFPLAPVVLGKQAPYKHALGALLPYQGCSTVLIPTLIFALVCQAPFFTRILSS